MKKATHVVFIHKDFIPDFQAIKGSVVSKDGAIYCHSVQKGHPDYLDVEAHVAQLHGDGFWAHLSIPHRFVSYIFEDVDEVVSKHLGFRAPEQNSDTQKE